MFFNCVKICLLCSVYLILQSCMDQTQEISCPEYFLKARKVINTANYKKLDSALFFINRSLECDANKAASVELKVTILYAMGRYQEGTRFIDSLNASDFSYGYKKQVLGDNFRSMMMDSLSRIVFVKRMDSSLTEYINTHKLDNLEEDNALIDLIVIKKRYMNATSINAEIDSLILSKPGRKDLLEKLRVSED